MTGPQPAVRLRGGGVSVATCAHLLAQDGFCLAGAAVEPRAPVPVIMLSDPALALLRDIFGQPGLFAALPRIERRVVSWGGSVSAPLPHGAAVVSGAQIEAELGLPALPADMLQEAPAPFTIHGAPPFPEPALRRFGTREAVAMPVTLRAGADRATCHVEATPEGWLFLIPQGANTAWLLGVGNAPEALLAQSRLVAPLVDTLGPAGARFETAPRLLDRLAGPDWIACGTAAIAFDPICGDGTAQAAREAILAAAVLAAIRDGGDREALLAHYRAMLIASMRRHLQVSLPFYRSGGDTPWWREQAEALAQGHAWCTGQLACVPEPRFVLRGNRLFAREAAA
ncbi:hypothetical protein [Novosphingobium sp.]|uniref:hypothetical protein n=2 Tax=Pseudomonadota TaxID=1224 RepID=UPI00352A025F